MIQPVFCCHRSRHRSSHISPSDRTRRLGCKCEWAVAERLAAHSSLSLQHPLDPLHKLNAQSPGVTQHRDFIAPGNDLGP